VPENVFIVTQSETDNFTCTGELSEDSYDWVRTNNFARQRSIPVVWWNDPGVGPLRGFVEKWMIKSEKI
jgi:hypothetical protein